MQSDQARDQLAHLLDWSEAHASLDDAVRGFPAELRGVRPHGLPHSAWELLEHIRISQRDILEFCGTEEYVERQWPLEYWPDRPDPPSPAAWDESLAGYRRDRAALQHLARHHQQPLTDAVPQGQGQTYLRELLLVADHTAYHVGQLVLLRRMLGAWPRKSEPNPSLGDVAPA